MTNHFVKLSNDLKKKVELEQRFISDRLVERVWCLTEDQAAMMKMKSNWEKAIAKMAPLEQMLACLIARYQMWDLTLNDAWHPRFSDRANEVVEAKEKVEALLGRQVSDKGLYHTLMLRKYSLEVYKF